jgi:sphingomyelin phosphodiesterase 3
MDLMYCDPEPDEDGEVRENLEYGGRRRIDRILYDPSCSNSKPVGYRFITSLAGLTDHVPVALSLETKV